MQDVECGWHYGLYSILPPPPRASANTPVIVYECEGKSDRGKPSPGLARSWLQPQPRICSCPPTPESLLSAFTLLWEQWTHDAWRGRWTDLLAGPDRIPAAWLSGGHHLPDRHGWGGALPAPDASRGAEDNTRGGKIDGAGCCPQKRRLYDKWLSNCFQTSKYKVQINDIESSLIFCQPPESPDLLVFQGGHLQLNDINHTCSQNVDLSFFAIRP